LSDAPTSNAAHPQVFVLGVNHLTAPGPLRDQLLFREDTLPAFVESLIEKGLAREAVVLSTCNRSEIYGVAGPSETLRPALEEAWSDCCGVDEKRLSAHDYFLVEAPAVRHLFRVIGSLDSMVLGEMQILGQVKEAYQLAAGRQWTDFYLNHLFQAGLHTGKRIHAETGIHEGAVSISYAAVELARKVLGDLRGKTVGLVGTGEMGELAAQHLHKAGVRGFLFFNRSAASADSLAASFGGKAHTMAELPSKMAQCDIVISATGATGIVITEEQVRAAARQRHGDPLFLIDIAAPADIEASAGTVENTFLFTIDDLKNAVQENVDLRREASRKAEAIVEEEAARITAWTAGLDVVPTLKALREKYQDMVEREIAKRASGATPEVRAQLEALGRGLLNKFLHAPTTRLKALGEQGEAQRASFYASSLFALDANESEEKSNADR
jgi:glutamyl-tRNA reductase